jgi:vancomycin resistance protein YoaR
MSRSPSDAPDPDKETPLAAGESGVASARRVPRWSSILVGIVGACALLLTAAFALSQRATGRVAAGVRVVDLDVSGLSRDELRARLESWAEQRAGAPLKVSLENAPLDLVPKVAGAKIDTARATELSLAAGREGSILTRFAGFVSRRFRPEVLPVAVSFDPLKLGSLLDEWETAKIKDHPFAGGLSFTGTSVTPLYAHAGTVIDRKVAQAQLLRAVAVEQQGVAIAVRTEIPNTDRAEVDRLVTLAQSMLSSEVELGNADGSRKLVLSPTDIAGLLQVKAEGEHAQLELFCAPEATQALMASRRAALEEQPQNAKFSIDAQDHVRVEPGHAGLVLDDVALPNAICAAAQDPTKKASLPLLPGAEPVLSTDAAEHLGIIGLMGSYTTRHACCQPRVQNIHHIADLLDGTLVKPGDTFSVNQVVGQRSVKNGFRPAPSIEDGEMVDTVGGGVSQFATTLFNALFYGGYDILERQPHTYWFTRYPMGYDATLSYPHPDIVFKNDTAAGALIKASYTDTTITVKIYGDNGGRRVRAEVSPRQSIVPPPVEYIPNRHLDADEEKAREGGMIGWSVIVKRTLTFPDGKIKEERRKVTYKPRARRVEVHPCKIPEGEPGHTGERCPKPDPDKAAVDDSAAPDTGAK